jgi:hypothetical protein
VDKIRLAFIEDDKIIRDNISEFLGGFPDLDLKILFSKAEDAIMELKKNPVDVVLMDIHLPGKNGIECVKELHSEVPGMQFLMCSSYDEPEKIFESLKAGANGYVLKSAPPEKLREAILDIHQGGSPMSPQIARLVVSSFSSLDTTSRIPRSLSSREQQILELLARGFQYKEIAEKLFLSTETVRSHLRRIYEKLQVRSKVEAINKVFPRG